MKRRVFKKWVVELLSVIIVGWLMLCMVTIDNLGNRNYNIIFIIWTGFAVASTLLLKKYSNLFVEE